MPDWRWVVLRGSEYIRVGSYRGRMVESLDCFTGVVFLVMEMKVRKRGVGRVELPPLRNVLMDVFSQQRKAASLFGQYVRDVYGFRERLRRHGAVTCGAGVLRFFLENSGRCDGIGMEQMKELVICVGKVEVGDGRLDEWVHYLRGVEGMRYLGSTFRVSSRCAGVKK